MKQITLYTINEHPNPENVYEWIRENWHDLMDFNIQELVTSLKAFAEQVNGKLDYAISAVPDRGEFIRVKYDRDEYSEIVENLYSIKDTCPLTGHCYDINVIEAAKDDNFDKLLTMIHNETDFIYSDEALFEHCEANEYYFMQNGKFVSDSEFP